MKMNRAQGARPAEAIAGAPTDGGGGPMGAGRRATAYHEAVHAVVSWALGHGVARIELLPATGAEDPRGMYHGLALTDAAGASTARERRRLARELCVVTLAGMVAERDLLGVDVDPLDTYEADRVDAIMRTCGIGPRGGRVGDVVWEGFKRRLAHEAVTLVRRHRRAIEALGEALCAAGSLTADEVRAGIERATTGRIEGRS